jgi:hypothetical protein
MNHYSRQELVTAILKYWDTYNTNNILSLATTEDKDLYRYVVDASEKLNISVAQFVKKYYNYEVYSSLYTEA